MSVYPRERISEALRDSVNRGIAMLIAPAGFGKSEATADAFGSDSHWIDLPEDGASVETLARLIIEKVSPRSMRALNAHLARPQTDENRSHLAEWCAGRLRTVDQPVVIEDFQRICSNDATIRFVRTVVEATVPNVRWVFISRETPELPVGTWLARDYMTLPISAEDLSFEVEEGRAVARALNVDIDDASILELVDDVGGWPLAVRLSLGAWERTRALPSLRIRTRVVLFEFIEQQVWSHLAEIDQRFFEAAAHLNELRPRILGASGFPEARLTLERLHRQLPLLSRVGNGNFRLHELFREFIIQRSKSDAESHQKLVTRLAQALERFGDLDGAIAMHMRAESWSDAIGLLARHGIDRMENGHRTEITTVLSRFPRQFLDHPVVTGLRGFALAIDGSFDLAKKELDQALKGELNHDLRGALAMQSARASMNVFRPTEAIPIWRQLMVDERSDPRLRLNAAAGLAAASALAGDVVQARDAIGFCSSALDAGSVEVRAYVSHSVAYAHLLLGEANIAEGYATESVQLAHSVGLDSIAARAYGVLQSAASAIYPDTVLARKYADACVRVASLAGDRSMQIFGYQAQLMVAAFQGDDEMFQVAERGLIEFGAERVSRNNMWMRFFKVVHESGLGNDALGRIRAADNGLGETDSFRASFCRCSTRLTPGDSQSGRSHCTFGTTDTDSCGEGLRQPALPGVCTSVPRFGAMAAWSWSGCSSIRYARFICVDSA